MDRKLCVLIYSKYSPASKNLIEYIQSLPYDFVKITGMTLLCADSKEVRSFIQKKSINVVPSLVIQYFDGTNQLLENELIYQWIKAIHNVIYNNSDNNTSTQPNSQNNNEVSNINFSEKRAVTSKSYEPKTYEVKNYEPGIIDPDPVILPNKKIDIMAAALEMQKSRDSDEPSIKRTAL